MQLQPLVVVLAQARVVADRHVGDVRLGQLAVQLPLAGRVQGAGRAVQEGKPRLREQQPGERKLLQLPDGYVILKPAGARQVAEMLNNAALEVEVADG